MRNKQSKKQNPLLLLLCWGTLLLGFSTSSCNWNEEEYTVEEKEDPAPAVSPWYGNGDFNSGLWGWTLVYTQIRLDNDTIASLKTAVDPNLPDNNTDQSLADNITTPLTIVASQVQNDGYGYSANLNASGITTKSANDVFHGPYMYSDHTASLSAGDLIRFEWQAQAYGDSFDVFGYIVNINDNHTEVILDNTSAASNSTQTWKTETHTVTQSGTYRFVFIGGSYDRTGGREVGAKLYIDDIVIIEN